MVKVREESIVAPCTEACPIGLDAPRYIRCIKEGKFDEALAVIREKLPLPVVCADACLAYCEDACANVVTTYDIINNIVYVISYRI